MKKIIIMAIICLLMVSNIAFTQGLDMIVEMRANQIKQNAPTIWWCRHETAVMASEMKTANIPFYVEFGEVPQAKAEDKSHCRIAYWKNGYYEVIDFTYGKHSNDVFVGGDTTYSINMGVEEDEIAFKKWIEARFGEILVYAIQLG